MCVYAHTPSQRTPVLCDDLVFLATGRYSCLSANCKALIPVNGKFKKDFLKSLSLETHLVQVDCVKCSLTNALGPLVAAFKIL